MSDVLRPQTEKPANVAPDDDLDEDTWFVADDDPVVIRLEQLAAHLPIPTDRIADLERNVMALYSETMEAATAREGKPFFTLPRFRRIFAAGLAAALLFASVAVAAAQSGPGEPFYHVRLTIEDITLPPPGSHDRLDAQIRLLTARLAETADAAARGNAAAVADAAVAYADRVDAAVGDFVAQRTPTLLADLLRDQQNVLATIVTQAPPSAQAAVASANAAMLAAQQRLAAPLPPECSGVPGGSPTGSFATPSLELGASRAPPTADVSTLPVPAATCPAASSPTPPPTSPSTGSPADTSSPTPGSTASPSASPSPTQSSSPSPTPIATSSPSPVDTPVPTPTPTPPPTPSPTALQPVTTQQPTTSPTPAPPIVTPVPPPTASPAGSALASTSGGTNASNSEGPTAQVVPSSS